MFVRDVVGQFEFMESNRLGHPLLASGRAVRVDVHPLGHLRVGLACHHPAGVVELVAAVVRGHDVQQQDVFGFFIQSVYPHLERREHPPADTKNAAHSQHGNATKTGQETSNEPGTIATEAPVEAARKRAAFWNLTVQITHRKKTPKNVCSPLHCTCV